MARKKDYTVRVACKLCEYYDVKATNEEDAIEQALEKASEDSLNDYIQIGDSEGLVTQINGKPVDPKMQETELMVLCSYDAEEAEYWNHLIVSKKVFYSPCGKKQIRKYLEEALEYKTMDDDDRKEFRKCVSDLLENKDGYFGDKYFWEETTAIL